MKTKHFFIICLLLLPGLMVAYAGDDKPITVEQLPKKAQEFLKTHFSDVKVSFAKMDNELFDKSYEVFFVNSGKIEFDGQGKWKEIECKYNRVPTGAIPVPIVTFIQKNHPENHVITIERDWKGYELKLNNGMELKFDLKYNFVRYDD